MVQEKTRLDTRQNYDRLSRWYDSFSSSEQRLTELGLRLLNILPGEKVLEIGFGTGHALIGLASAVGKAGSVYGIDLSPGMIIVARRRARHSGMGGRISMQVGDASRLPFPNNQFQTAFMSFTLELFEIKEIPVILSECQRVLQPGGSLGIVSLAKKDTRAEEIYEWFHFRFPKIVDCRPILIRPLLEAAGFEVGKTVVKRLWGLPVEAVVAKRI
jgi:demethylmenaquinone methyltransferase/2-methoxy-6-polyprenyl-1,4-benzoquinol methylase